MQGRRLYVVRHGHRADFIGEVWSPQWDQTHDRGFDPPLSERGIEQAKSLGERLKGEPIDHVFASPFLRTVQTAHFANAVAGRKVHIEPGISEWLHPEWYPVRPDLLPPSELANTYPTVDPTYKPTGRLNYPERNEQVEVWPRVMGTVNELLSRNEGNLLLVTHASPVEGIWRHFTGSQEPIDVRTCTVFLYEQVGETWQLMLCGADEHLTC